MDKLIYAFVQSLHGTPIDNVGIFLAEYSKIFFAVIFAGVCLKLILSADAQKWGKLAVALATIGTTLLANSIIRMLVSRERPFIAIENAVALIEHSAGNSFPSNHAAAAMAVALTVFFVSPKLGKWIVSVALSVALSRLWVGVHYPSDIIVGCLLAILCFALLSKATASFNSVVTKALNFFFPKAI